MFLYKNLFFSISILSIPIMYIGINGGYLPGMFRHFAWNLSDFSRLVSLFCNSAQSPFKQQLLGKAMQNEESQYKKNQIQK